jgi:hypothetical protein
MAPYSCLYRAASSITLAELDALCRRVWREQDIVSFAVDDIVDPWLRQALINEATRRWGARGDRHGA